MCEMGQFVTLPVVVFNTDLTDLSKRPWIPLDLQATTTVTMRVRKACREVGHSAYFLGWQATSIHCRKQVNIWIYSQT